MTDEWTTIFESTVEGRPIRISTYNQDHSYRIETTQAADESGVVARDESTIAIVDPTVGGSELAEFAGNAEELSQKLFNLGLSEKAVGDIARTVSRV